MSQNADGFWPMPIICRLLQIPPDRKKTFDPLDQVLEHYSYLQFSAKQCASAGDSLVLYSADDGEDC